MQDIDTQRDGKSMVIKTTTRLEREFSFSSTLFARSASLFESPLVRPFEGKSPRTSQGRPSSCL